MGESLYFLAGVTSSGKSELALSWAESHDAEILSCDSIAVYRGMDLGAAKATAEQRKRVPHHGLDLADVTEGYDVSRYERYARNVVSEVLSKGKNLLVVGGSGFYLQSFFEPIVDEVVVTDETRAKVETLYEREGIPGLLAQLRQLNGDEPLGLDELNPQRLLRALERCLGSGLRLSQLRERFEALPTPYASLRKQCLWLDRPNEDLEKRIESRTGKMIDMGLVEETESLIERGFLSNHAACSSVGYRDVCSFLRNEITREELNPAICSSTRKLVSKQRKWFRKRFPPSSRFLLGPSSEPRSGELKWSSDA
ncbi:MAG: tRNA (adenosine(37)-N6)-dimethylallyltransferase MiaA [Opitutae bacterium]|jgi:tRNA dimethylallyltransferase|nr:tRNA (adenosine(37)-N6)-dimethylallyltransferase MiaA [Opitutae bacterium]